MKFASKFTKTIVQISAFLLLFSMAQGQDCELTLEPTSISYSEVGLPTPNPGSFDVAINYSKLSCSGVSGDLCICECYLAIYFTPLDPTFLTAYPQGLEVNDMAVAMDGNMQSLNNLPVSQIVGYFVEENVLLLSLGVQSNLNSGTLLISFLQDPPSTMSVSVVTGLCVIDNIDKPTSATRNDVVLHHLGLDGLEPYLPPR